MRRGRIFIYLAFILLLGILAAVIFFSRQGQGPGQAGEAGGQVATPVNTAFSKMVITTQNIRRGDEIGEGVIQLVDIAQGSEFEGMFHDTELVIGQFSRFDLKPGTPLTEAMVTTDLGDLGRSGSDPALQIEPGMVAVSIPINRLSSVSFGLRPGDSVSVIVSLLFVDLDPAFQSILPNNSYAVLAPGPALQLSITEDTADGQSTSSEFVADELVQSLTAQIISGGVVSPIGRVELDPTLGQPFYVVPSEAQRARSVSQTLIPAAKVLFVGTFPSDNADDKAEPTATPEGQAPEEQNNNQPQPTAVPPSLPDVITLVVSPQDAVTLNYLLLNGAYLSLAMRPANDDARVQTEAVTLQFLLDQYNIPVPAKLPYGLEPRLDALIPPILTNDITPTPSK